MSTISDKLQYLLETKELIKQALINKGFSISDTDSFRSYVDMINQLGIHEPTVKVTYTIS